MPVGHRVVSFSMQDLKAQTLEMRWPVDLTIGSINTGSAGRGGFFLGTDLRFLEYYLEGTDDKDVILDYSYEEADLLAGTPSGSNEVYVAKGTLVGARFHDEALQEKFGHLLNPATIQERRERNRGACLKDIASPREYSLIRAMSSEVKHIFPMDYAYKAEYRTLPRLAQRVLKDYEEGTQARTVEELMLRMTLNHAVTTAIYEDAPQHVTMARVPASKVFKATNEGEFFYDSETPTAVITLFEVDAAGNVSIPAAPKRELDDSPSP